MRVGGVVHFCSTLTKRECQSHALEGPFFVQMVVREEILGWQC